MFLDVLDLDLQLFAELLVERAQRFVHQHKNRVEDERAGERDTLLLPTRQLDRAAVVKSLELNQFKCAGDATLYLRLPHLSDQEREGQILRHGHVREKGIVLKHYPDVPAIVRHAQQGLATQTNLSRSRNLKSGKHHERSRLPRSRRSEKR